MANDGGSAFPLCRTEADGRNDCLSMGMSLRDWFAGQALSGWLASFGADDNVEHIPSLVGFIYQMADAMIAERSKEAPNG